MKQKLIHKEPSNSARDQNCFEELLTEDSFSKVYH